MSLKSHIISGVLDNIKNSYSDIKAEDYLIGKHEYTYSYTNLLKGRSCFDRLLNKVNLNDLKNILMEIESNESIKKKDSLKSKLFGFPSIEDAEYLFSILATDFGRKRFIDSFLFQSTGSRYTNLIQNFIKTTQHAKQLLNEHIISISEEDNNWKLYDMQCFGYPIKFWYDSIIQLIPIYSLHQHSCINPQLLVNVENDDICIDCGGYVGESALIFSYLLKGKGHIYSYEIDDNLIKYFKKNLSLNPKLSRNITIIPNACGEDSNKILRYNSSL